MQAQRKLGHLLFSGVFLMPRTVSGTYQMFGYYILNEWIMSEGMLWFTTLNTKSLLNSLKVFYGTWLMQNHWSQTIATLFCITVILKNINWLLVQDSRIEGYALNSSCKSTKSANSCWITIDRKMLCYAMLCYAKSLKSCPTLCDPIDGSPPGSPVPGILQASTLEWAAISFSNAWKWKVKVKSLTRVRLLATPWIAA